MGRIRIIPKGRGRIIAPPFAVGAPDTSRQMCANVAKEPCLNAAVAKAACPKGNAGQAIDSRAWVNVVDIAQIFLRSFYIKGDHASEFSQGDTVQIIGSDRADGDYTVAGAWYCSGTGRTRVKVEETIAAGPTDLLNLVDSDFSPFRIFLPAKLYDNDYHCGDLSGWFYKGQMCCEIARAECA